jgi:hypothetical protein
MAEPIETFVPVMSFANIKNMLSYIGTIFSIISVIVYGTYWIVSRISTL